VGAGADAPGPRHREDALTTRARGRQRRLTAYETVRDLIVRGRLAPGARLVETELAEVLGVSRTPVREAIVRLVQEGLAIPLRNSHRVQVAVAPLAADDLSELYTVMAALEGAVARRIETLAPARRKQLVGAMTEANRRFERIGRSRPADFERLFETHNVFHALLVDRCATPRLRAFIDQVRPQIHRYEYLYAGMVGPDYSATFSEHRDILRALGSGRAADAERAVRANWLNSATRLARASLLPSVGDVGAYSRAARPAARVTARGKASR
jgi:DNA-binding GntR family transcriptional regulator